MMTDLLTSLAAFEAEKLTPDELLEREERLAIQQEGCGQEIEVVRRDPKTGELKST